LTDVESVTLSLEPPIAHGATADLHDWRDGRVLKLYRSNVPRSAGAREARITRALYDAGVRVPKVEELVEVNGRLGLPMEKLYGAPLASRLVDAESGHRAGRVAAEVHVAMHARSEQSLQTMRVQFRWVIERSALSTGQKNRVLQAMEALPDGERICHGDFHAANIFMTDGGPVVIDCGVAHRGNPRADVAQTCVAMKEWLYLGLPESRRRAVEHFIGSYEARYFELSPECHDEVVAWQPIVAAVRFGLGHPPSSSEPLLRMIEEGLQ
jgi:Ser/Thr protein kinase RdoA (MazF antagonist)